MKYISYVIAFILITSLVSFYLTVRPTRYLSTVTPSQFGLRYETVRFKTDDGITLKGWFIPNKNPHAKTIILLHGYPADKGNILPSRIFLHKDYHLLLIDFRFLGESEGNYSTLGINEVKDVHAALSFLKQRGIHKVGVWGFSMGGATALLALKDAPEIKAVVAESSYARLDWLANRYYPIPGFDFMMGQLFRAWGKLFLQIDLNTAMPIDVLAYSTIPILLLYAKNDALITYDHALAMRDAAKNNAEVSVIIYPEKNHGEPADNYQTLVKDFFAKHLR